MSQFKKIVESNLKKYGYDLTEAKQVGLLYHAVASLSDLIEILKSDELYSARDIGISTSRQLKNTYSNGDWARPAILVLDGDKLSEEYKILPFQYPGEPNNYETIIQTNKRKYYKKHNSEYPLNINDYLNWINKLHNDEDEDGDYECEGDYSNGGTLIELHKYLIKIILNETEISKYIKNNKEYYPSKKVYEELSEINKISNVPIEYKKL